MISQALSPTPCAGAIATHSIREGIQSARSVPAIEAAKLAHDLRQPLTTIKMNLQAAIRLLQAPQPRVAAALDAISDCLTAEAHVVSMLAAIDQPPEEVLPPPLPVELNVVALEVQAHARHADAGRRGRVDLRLAEHSPRILGNAARLGFVLRLLVQSALQCHEERKDGRVRVLIRTRADDDQAELSVRGIPYSPELSLRLQGVLALTRTVAALHFGTARFERRGASAAVRLLFPLMSPRDGGPRAD